MSSQSVIGAYGTLNATGYEMLGHCCYVFCF